MNREELENLLDDYGRQRSPGSLFTDEERAELRVELVESVTDHDPMSSGRARNRRLRRPRSLLAFGAIATAAVVGIFIGVGEYRPLSLQIEAVTSGSVGHLTRGEERFEIAIVATRPVWVHLIVLDERGNLTILPGSENGSVHVDGEGRLGSYAVFALRPDVGVVRRTHAIVVASKKPIPLELLAATAPDRLPKMADAPASSELERLCRKLEQRFACTARATPIPGD